METGTLGPSARAKVPVFAAESSDTGGAVVSSGAGEVVGEISVGFAPQRVFADVVGETMLVAGAALLALTIGLVASMLIRRRLRRLTLGLGPEELAALVQNQAAVLGGVGEGVLGVSPDGVVTVCTDQAARLLDIGSVVGRRFDELDLPDRLVDLVADDSASPTWPSSSSGPASCSSTSGRCPATASTSVGWSSSATAPTSRRSPGGSTRSRR